MKTLMYYNYETYKRARCQQMSNLRRNDGGTGAKRLAGSNEPQVSGGKYRDSCRNAELEAESSRF